MTNDSAARSRLRLPGGLRVPGSAVAVLALIAFGVLVLAPTISTYLAERSQISALTVQVKQQQAALKSVDQQVAQWSDPAYIRAQAGSRLYYVLPGERTYRVVGTVPAAAPAQPAPTKAVQQTRTDWVGTLLGSLETAGTTTSPPAKLDPALGK